MVKYSAIITKDLKVFGGDDFGDSHGAIMEKYNLDSEDEYEIEGSGLVFVDVSTDSYTELTKKFKRDRWDYREHNEGVCFPSWYIKNKRKIKEQVFNKLEQFYQANADKFIPNKKRYKSWYVQFSLGSADYLLENIFSQEIHCGIKPPRTLDYIAKTGMIGKVVNKVIKKTVKQRRENGSL